MSLAIAGGLASRANFNAAAGASGPGGQGDAQATKRVATSQRPGMAATDAMDVVKANAAPTTDDLANDLVKYAESKPAQADIVRTLLVLQSGPLGAPLTQLLAALGPVTSKGETAEQQRALLVGLDEMLDKARSAIAGGSTFEAARAAMAKTDQTGADVAAVIDDTTKLKLAWAMFHLSALVAESVLGKK